jgi:hypothetical protein
MLKEALNARCTACGWSRADAILLRLPPTATRRQVVGTSGADVGHYTATGLVAARTER